MAHREAEVGGVGDAAGGGRYVSRLGGEVNLCVVSALRPEGLEGHLVGGSEGDGAGGVGRRRGSPGGGGEEGDGGGGRGGGGRGGG